MKKFMRIALVFALAGATLVGCTKDYSGDISDLNKKVTEQASALSALQTQVGAAQTAADAAAQKAAEALAEAQKKASSADVQAAEERVNAKINDLVNGDVKALKDAVAALEGIKADERLTALETAIKDFVTKAEFAQELAALKDELEDAIAAGDKLNADAIAKLEEKVEGILASLSINSVKVLDGYTGITAAYGKFTAAGVKNAAKWKGPKADEIAKIKRGDFVFGTGANEIIVQVNPADADITDAEISLQTSECVEAPIVFGTPYPFEGKLTKSENGLWALPFVVEEFTEEESTEIDEEFDGAKMALVVNGVRTDYDMTFGIVEGNTTGASPVAITEEVAKASGEGTFVFEPEYAPQILDAYITDVTDADSLRYDITYDGMSFTYDVEKVQKRVEATKKDVEITFKVSYMNLVGGVCDGKTAKTVTLKIKHEAADPVAPTVYQFAAEAAHDAVAFHGTTDAEKEASGAEQALVVDFKEFFDEFAPTKAEKDLWLQDWKLDGVRFYGATITENDEIKWEDKDLISYNDWKTTGTLDTDKAKLTISFPEDYGSEDIVKLDGKSTSDHFVAKVCFKNQYTKDIIEAVVPFKINAPSATEIAKWYNWDNQHNYDGTALCINNSGEEWLKIALKENFVNAKGYDVTLIAPIVSRKNTDDVDEYFPGVVLPTFGDHVANAVKDHDSAWVDDYKQSTTYKDHMFYDFLQLNWSCDGTDVVRTDKNQFTHYFVYPYWKFDSNLGNEKYNSLELYFWNRSGYAENYINKPLTVSGLAVKAMDGRQFTIPSLAIKVVGETTATNSVSFTPTLEIDRTNFNHIGLYNALYEPDRDEAVYYGSFALKDETGKAMKFGQNGASWSYNITTYTATTLNANDVPNWGGANAGAIQAKTFEYQSQISAHGDPTSVAGLKLVDNGVNTLNPDVDTLYVKIEITDTKVLYVLDGSPYKNSTGKYVVTFEIKVK